MNQAILLNDDLTYLAPNTWQCTGMLSGEKITIVIKSNVTPETFDQSIKFDWEIAIEDWLEEHEPDENNQLNLSL